MIVHGYTKIGSILVTIDGETWDVPDDMSSRMRQLIYEWEFDEDGNRVNTIPPYVPEPEPPVIIIVNSFDFWDRVTETESDEIEDWLLTQTSKFRRMFNAATEYRSDNSLWETLEPGLKTLFGEVRAAQLLASSATERNSDADNV